MKVTGYEWWVACLEALAAGEVPLACPERDVIFPGRYWIRWKSGEVVGLAVDPLDGGAGFRVLINKGIRFDLNTQAQVEDWCEKTFAWACENPVSSDEYAAWWATGTWPPEVAEREAELKRRRRERIAAQRRPRNPPTNEASA